MARKRTRPKKGTNPTKLTKAKKDLSQFLELNKSAEVKYDDDILFVDKPWGDETVAIVLDESPELLIEILNKSILPDSLSAIIHTESAEIEFIWTAHPVEEVLLKRTFDFTFSGKVHTARFGLSSPRLELIAKSSVPSLAHSSTNHRNLASYAIYFLEKEAKKKETSLSKKGKPVSFFVTGIDKETTDLVDMCRTLNFYMRRFDRKSPQLLIHETTSSERWRTSSSKPYGEFPENITLPSLNPFALSLWESAQLSPDSMREFLYYFQIVEYAADQLIDHDVFREIHEILTRPDCQSKAREYVFDALAIAAKQKTDEYARFKKILERALDIDVLWLDIEANQEYFSETREFDGGLTLNPIVARTTKRKEFEKVCFQDLTNNLREIRNGLVHAGGKQKEMILPTESNYHQIVPYVFLARTIASQVIDYSREF